jgi:hypothetical protein
MNKTKKNIYILITIVLSIFVIFACFYLFKEVKKMVSNNMVANKNLADLEIAKQKIDLEKKQLDELRSKSYAMQVSLEQYLKIKSLVDKTNIFFKDADSLNPQIQIKTKNRKIEDKINAQRLKINKLLLTWEENNKHSLETDQVLINQIKTAVLYIESYVEQIQSIVFELSSNDSGLSNEQINSYRNVITGSVFEIKQVITTINIAETAIKESIKNNSDSNSNEITKQIEVIRNTENTIINLENAINNTSTTSNTLQNNDNTISTTTETKVSLRPKIVNPEPSIIYQQNPAPYKNTGVDVNTSSQMSPLQDW